MTQTPLPESIGRYRIRRRIGEGGMGVVFEAEQDNPRRTVALKLIHSRVFSESTIRRFALEAQVLGRLQHPGIAQIYEADTFHHELGEQPFFAMEFVDGVPLTQYAEQQRLSTPDRLELLAKVCDALQHAHQRGVIHRDLKPANLLVDATGQPKLLDFGLAMATDADCNEISMHTDAGQLLGTLPYMSPEQTSGNSADLDTRSDLYSLGVILYEILAKAPPYPLKAMSLPQAIETIREREPRPLGAVHPELRGDVETIARKALEKSPEARYQSAAAFSADLRAFLSDQPISARDPSTLYQFRKFVRRNKALVVGLSSALAALIIGLCGTLWGFFEARREQKVAQAESTRANQAAGFLKEILRGVSPEIAMGKDTALVRDLLHTSSGRLAKDLGGFPLVEAELREVIGDASLSIGDYPFAEQEYRRAVEISRERVGPYGRQTLLLRKKVAVALNNLGRGQESLEMLSQAFEDACEHLGDDAVTDLIRGELGVRYWSMQRLADAQPLLEESLRRRRARLGDDDDSTLIAMNCLGLLRIDQGRMPEAEELLRETLDRRIRVSGELHPDTIKARHNLGALFLSLGRFTDAEPLYRAAMLQAPSTYGAEHPVNVDLVKNLANLYVKMGRLKEAEEFGQLAFAMSTKLSGLEHPTTIYCAETLSKVFRKLDLWQPARQVLEKVRDACIAKFGAEHEFVLGLQSNLADVLHESGDSQGALSLRLSLLASMQRRLGPEHSDTLLLQHQLGTQHFKEGRLDQAEPLLKAALSGMRSKQGMRAENTQLSALALALVYLDTARPEPALPLFAEALEFWIKLPHPGDQTLDRSLKKMAQGFGSVKGLAPVAAPLQFYVRLLSERPETDFGELIQALVWQGTAQVGLGDYDEALETCTQAQDLLDARDEIPRVWQCRVLLVHGRALVAQELFDDAERILDECWSDLLERDDDDDAALRREVAKALAELHRAQQRFETAAEWDEKAGK